MQNLKQANKKHTEKSHLYNISSLNKEVQAPNNKKNIGAWTGATSVTSVLSSLQSSSAFSMRVMMATHNSLAFHTSTFYYIKINTSEISK